MCFKIASLFLSFFLLAGVALADRPSEEVAFLDKLDQGTLDLILEADEYHEGQLLPWLLSMMDVLGFEPDEVAVEFNNMTQDELLHELAMITPAHFLEWPYGFMDWLDDPLSYPSRDIIEYYFIHIKWAYIREFDFNIAEYLESLGFSVDEFISMVEVLIAADGTQLLNIALGLDWLFVLIEDAVWMFSEQMVEEDTIFLNNWRSIIQYKDQIGMDYTLEIFINSELASVFLDLLDWYYYALIDLPEFRAIFDDMERVGHIAAMVPYIWTLDEFEEVFDIDFFSDLQDLDYSGRFDVLRQTVEQGHENLASIIDAVAEYFEPLPPWGLQLELILNEDNLGDRFGFMLDYDVRDHLWLAIWRVDTARMNVYFRNQDDSPVRVIVVTEDQSRFPPTINVLSDRIIEPGRAFVQQYLEDELLEYVDIWLFPENSYRVRGELGIRHTLIDIR